jgi:hypothetical protein
MSGLGHHATQVNITTAAAAAAASEPETLARLHNYRTAAMLWL